MPDRPRKLPKWFEEYQAAHASPDAAVSWQYQNAASMEAARLDQAREVLRAYRDLWGHDA